MGQIEGFAAAKAGRLFSVSEGGPWVSMIDDRHGTFHTT
jgi:hypothetical protein